MRNMPVAMTTIAIIAAAMLPDAAAPAWAQDGAETERFDWPSHNLDLYGSRYAAIDQIDTSNAGRLELAWSVEMEREHVITQVTPIVVDGVLHFNDAAGAAFALDGATGERLWTSDFDPDSISKRVIRPRGPGYGGGRLYPFYGTTIFSIDPASGEPDPAFGDGGRIDIVAAALHYKYPDDYPPDLDPAALGHQMMAPPAYHDGTLYAGVGLSDQHIPGGLVIAADARTAEIRWVFNTIPQRPTDEGYDVARPTWGDGLRAGGGVWTVPAIDPELGLVYVNAGNPSADYDGSGRPGMNLFTNATIALRMDTGEIAWYYQAIHHEVWDIDHVTGPILFDATRDGRTVRGVGAGGKNCLMYMWDRATGKPLNPMVEMAVPTETDVPGEQIWPTQPFPYNARGVPMDPFCATYPIVTDPADRQWVRQLYTPYSMTHGYVVAHGGSSWGPPSFSPRTGLLYMTGKDGSIALTVRPVGDSIEVGQGRGGMTSQVGSKRDQMPPELTLTAYEPVSGELVWQARAPTRSAIGVSGNLATAGDLVLQGTDTGQFYAFDARTGEQLFEYVSDKPVRSSPMTYQVDGRQYIVVVASNEILAFALPAS